MRFFNCSTKYLTMILTGKHYWVIGLLCLVLGLNAQNQPNGALLGTITDEATGEALVGAGVTIIGTYKGSATDFDGKYLITGLKPGDYNLKVQYIGYGTLQFNGIRVNAGENKVLDIKMKSATEALQEVTVIGRQSQVNLELAASEISVGREQLAQMNSRDVQEVVAMQAGVVKTTDGLQIRGARVYETEYIVDGISAQDPLAGTGFGVQVASSSVQSLDLITGGVGAEYGGGSSGVINTKIREGGEKLEVSGSYQMDHLFGSNVPASFNTDIMELTVGLPINKKKNLTLFNNLSANLTDEYFGTTASELRSSLFPNNPSFWAPRYTNSFSHTVKIGWQLAKGSKLTITNQHSLNINQNTRTLQIVGFDAILQPGFQYPFSLNLDNATTYTHHSNLTALNLKHILNERWGLTFSVGRLFTNLRADANGRPFRYPTVDQIYDPYNIITNPVSVFNPNDPSGIYYVLPGNGLINNGGISTLWHDHYAQEYTLKAKANWYPSKTQDVSFGFEHQFLEYQWVDVSRPWVGAPIKINDTLTTPSVSVGSSNDIWRVKPQEGGIFIQDKITYKGIIATLGVRLNYWAPGAFADEAVDNPKAPVIDQIRTDYKENTIGVLGLRWKARVLPKVNVSFPVTENNVLFFNYGHSMRIPHPRFVYAGLDPVYQDRSFLASLGNPDLNPEVNVSYEIGVKSQITRDLGLNFTAYNNNRFDYIVSRRVIVLDQTGRPATKNMYINQDYAKIIGLEAGAFYRFGKDLNVFANIAYQVARGKSNTARESSLQIEQNGEVSLTREQYLAFDRPWTINAGITFTPHKESSSWMGFNPEGFRAFLSFNYTSGFRYTPQRQVAVNDLGRPEFEIMNDRFLEELATPWINFDLKLNYDLNFGESEKGLVFSVEIRNLFDNKNAQIINPVTGRAYEYGDDVPNTWRDPRPEYNGPAERGLDPRDPARYLAPRQILYGIAFRF